MNTNFEDTLFDLLDKNDIKEIMAFAKMDYYAESYVLEPVKVTPPNKSAIIYEPIPSLNLPSFYDLVYKAVFDNIVFNNYNDYNDNYKEEYCVTFFAKTKKVIVDKLGT
jgi:hypothetical protein